MNGVILELYSSSGSGLDTQGGGNIEIDVRRRCSPDHVFSRIVRGDEFSRNLMLAGPRH